MPTDRFPSIAAHHSPDAIYVVAADGTVLYANPAAAELFGYEQAELEGTSYLDAVHPDDREEATAGLAALIEGRRERIEVRRRIATKDGLWLHVGLSARRAEFDGRHAVIGSARDIREAVDAEARLVDANAFLERLIEVSPMVAFRREGPDLKLTYVSPNVTEILGLRKQDVLGAPVARAFERAHPDDRNRVRDQIERALSGEVVEVTYRLLVPGQRVRWVVSTVRPDPSSADATALLGYMFDVTSQRRVEAELEWLALHDPLTSLANRAKFDSDAAIHLALSARKGWDTALMYIDLDRFKDVNDTFGHDAGDDVLETLASRIAEAVRDGDLTARLGGDEFVIMLPDVGKDATPIAERLHRALTAPVELGKASTSVGASIGIAFFPHDAEDLDTLRRRADQAMYAAKAAGTSYRFWSDLDGASRDG